MSFEFESGGKPRFRDIPVVDARRGGPAAGAEALSRQVDDIFAVAKRRYTPAGLAVGDWASRRWLSRNANPYLGEIDAVAEAVGRTGAHLLNCSYEWACTSGVRPAEGGNGLLVRVLDWDLEGLGRNLAVVRQSGAAGEWLNVGWPGFAGVITGVAPGRFAAAINQPPMPSRGLGMVGDWLTSRPAVWRSGGLPPSHLLRKAFDEAAGFEQAVALLTSAEVSSPVFYTVAGSGPGQGCVIERSRDHVAVRWADPAVAVANEWVALAHLGGVARGAASGARRRQMEELLRLASPEDLFSLAWLREPILNDDTRVVMVADPATGRVMLQGWEEKGPATWTKLLGAARS